MNGIDCTNPAGGQTACLLADGQEFVIRYVSQNTQNFPKKRLTREEGQALSAAGIWLGAVWEMLPADDFQKPAHFHFDNGLNDGKATYAYMESVLKAPASACVYFAVDYDTTEHEDKTIIAAYFAGLRRAFLEMDSFTKYLIGVYAGGATIDYLTSNGLCDMGWLTLSTGFRGSAGFEGWQVKQLEEKTICGLDADTNVAQSSVGFFKLEA